MNIIKTGIITALTTLAINAMAAKPMTKEQADRAPFVSCYSGKDKLYSGKAKLSFPKAGGVKITTPDGNTMQYVSFGKCIVEPPN